MHISNSVSGDHRMLLLTLPWIAPFSRDVNRAGLIAQIFTTIRTNMQDCSMPSTVSFQYEVELILKGYKTMPLQLYMIGLTVQDMEKSQEFYRRLGLDIPEGSLAQPHVEIKMGEDFTFFLDTRAIKRDNPAAGESSENYRVLFEYYLKSQAAVEAKYAELIGYGYQSYRAPFIFPNGMCFALVNDPDGNTILLSGDANNEETAPDGTNA